MKIIKLSVPLFIRLLEWAREEAKTDMSLHFIAEYVSNKDELAMKDYETMMKSIPNNNHS